MAKILDNALLPSTPFDGYQYLYDLGDYGYIDYSDGLFYLFVRSQYDVWSSINSTLTVSWDTWWTDHEGGSGSHTETATDNQLWWRGDNWWIYTVPITYDMGEQSPGATIKWGVGNLRWQWKTEKPGDSWTDSKYNYIIKPFGGSYPNWKVDNPNW